MCLRELNLELAYLTSHYKNELSDKHDHSIELPSREDFLKKHYYCLEELLSCQKSPIFVIYNHPDRLNANRTIGIKTFVTEYVGQGLYPVWLASFDIHCDRREKGTKKDPHFSSDNGTLYMLMHDMDHAIDNNSYEETVFLASYDVFSVSSKLSVSDQDIIISGLYLLFHEGVHYIIKELYNKRQNHQILQDSMRDAFINQTEKDYKRKDYNYKMTGRDWEFALKCKDENGNPFLPTIAINTGKERTLPISKWGEKYEIIQNPEDFKTEMEWIKRNADAPEGIYDKRQELMSSLVKEGFKRFTEQFCEILTKLFPS